jgi:hypothetical protein
MVTVVVVASNQHQFSIANEANHFLFVEKPERDPLSRLLITRVEHVSEQVRASPNLLANHEMQVTRGLEH